MRITLVFAVLAIAAPARADDSEPPATFHKGQVGVSARFGFGVRGIATFNSDYCGVLDSTAKNGNAPVCSGRSPFAFDIEASYGVAQHIELLFEMSIGLEKDFGAASGMEGPRPFHIAPGARFFFSEAKRSKLFVQPEIVLDFTGYKKPDGSDRGTDYGVRGLEGYWFDLHRTYGIYAFVGETIEAKRWLYADLEFGFGIQGRYP